MVWVLFLPELNLFVFFPFENRWNRLTKTAYKQNSNDLTIQGVFSYVTIFSVPQQHVPSIKCVQTTFPTPLEYFTDKFHWKDGLNENNYICYRFNKNYHRILKIGYVIHAIFVLDCITKNIIKKYIFVNFQSRKYNFHSEKYKKK